MRILIELQACQTQNRVHDIGRHSLALAQAMARNAGHHDIWLVLNGSFPETIPEIRRAFDGLVPKERVRVFDVPTPIGHLSPENAWRIHAAELLREEFLRSVQADIVHVSSLFEGFEDNAVTSVGRLHDGERTAVTLHDLTPLAMPHQLLGSEPLRAWYHRKLLSLKSAGLLLGTSKFSCGEAVTRLGLPENRVVNISYGVDPRFRRLIISPGRERDLRCRYQLTKPFLLTAGGADPHENIDGLITAIGLLPSSIRNSHQLAVASSITHRDRAGFMGVARRAGLDPNQIVFTGPVSEEERVEIYNLAELYVMPSWLEGFGLSAVEAMACGVPTIGSNRTGVPEAIGWEDALFDPFQPSSMAAKISQVVTNKGFRQTLVDHGMRHVRSFSWDTTAKRAITALEKLHARQKPRKDSFPGNADKLLLAIVAPAGTSWRTHENLLAEIARFYEVELVSDERVVLSPSITANFRRRPTLWFDDHAERYDRIVHLFENERIALAQLAALSRRPGTALMHRWITDPDSTCNEDPATNEAGFRQLIYSAEGYAALARAQNEGFDQAIVSRCLRHEVAKLATGMIHMGSMDRSTRDCVIDQDAGCARIPSYPRSTVDMGDVIAGAMFDASALYEAIETCAAQYPKLRHMALLQKLVDAPPDVAPTDTDYAQVAAALARQEPTRQRTLYLDISMFALNDNKSGIHRVVRNIVRELLMDPPQGIRVETVREQDGVFWTACVATCSLLALSPPFPEERVVEFRQGDILFGVDLTADLLPPLRQFLKRIRGRGIELWFIVHDLLPIQHPEWFPPTITSWFRPWLDTVLECADGIVCPSKAVATELQQFSQATPGRNQPRIDFVHWGAEVNSAAPGESKLPADAEAVLRALAEKPSFLMVGTLEPRKGHEIALGAFERLWERGVDANLVIVGPQGWKVESLVRKLNSHPQRQRRLYWLGRISDAYLNKIYEAASALIAASQGEGFGLPIVEAALHGKPVIASDLPVFREVAGTMASVLFFSPDSVENLAAALQLWLDRKKEFQQSAAAAGRWISWAESAKRISRLVIGA